jgi:hydrogenase maturation protein HypF
MCELCRAEYTDPANRRFHAEPNACPACGPQLSRPVEEAAADLLAGKILAVKGLGGYHLACDATNDAAVGELRRRKARDDKPFAVMVRDVDEARRLCRLTPAAVDGLRSPRRPIVLAPKLSFGDGAGLDDAGLSPRIAPRLPELGLMLPYTPLHHMLMDAVAPRPLVMTSGNLSDEPIAHEDADAATRLGPMVDATLTHNRAIHIRCDDSVVRSRGQTTQMIRRSRGYAPEPIPLSLPTPKHILAVGAELKNTVSVAKGRNVVASHHIGDLEHLAAYRSFLQAVDHLCHLTGVTPELVAHDLHPEYLSTKFAADLDVPLVAVQHHHAHIASCLAEHGRAPDQPVLGIAFDGLGMGADGTIWGGELLVADLRGYRRVGHLRPVPLVSGDLATKEPWRMALVWADTALGRDEAARYGASVDERWKAVLALAERPDALLTTSAGRLFDAVAALLGLRARVTYEAQAAVALEALATTVPAREAPDEYPVAIEAEPGAPTLIDPSPLVARVVAERDRGTPTPLIAAGFHAALGRAVADAATDLARANGLDTVALSGGVFQNARLTEVVESALTSAGLTVLVHHLLPPNDGGVSVGQAAIAAARAAAGEA